MRVLAIALLSACSTAEVRAQATFARRQPQPATVQMIGGQPQFVIGGKPYAPIIHGAA